MKRRRYTKLKENETVDQNANEKWKEEECSVITNDCEYESIEYQHQLILF